MDWGAELWDQFDTVDKHHQHEIEFSEKYAKFVKDRCSIEMDYASKLRKLAKANQPKKKVDDRSIFSTHKSFLSQLAELNDIAGQHEVVAEEMLTTINKVLLSFCNELKVEKKKLYQDGKNQQLALDQQEKALEQTKKKFEKEWKECERAHANFEKLDSDINVTKIEVEKAKHAWMAKKDSVESCKTDYGAALQTFNKDQADHFNENMPKLFQSYKDADQRRILKTRDAMVDYSKIDMKVKPLIQKCLEEMEKAANSVDPEQDTQLVVERLKSGFTPPSDKEFEDCTQPQQPHRNHSENGSEASPRANHNKAANKKGGRWMFGRKKVPESPDYSHLPPEQRRKKLLKLINDLKRDISKEEEGKKAIIKMQEVYRSNPALGDADSLAGQLKISNSKLDKLQAELKQLETWHADATGAVHPSPGRPSRSEKPTESVPKTQAKPVAASAPPSSVPPPNETQNPVTDQHNEPDEFDEEPEPIGTCVALYDFEASSDGALSMKAGEVFSILEADGGDGWTRAIQGDKDGYVPTTYLEVTFFT